MTCLLPRMALFLLPLGLLGPSRAALAQDGGDVPDATPAEVDPAGPSSFARKPVLGRPVLDVRLSASGPTGSEDLDHPYLCVSGLPHERILLEGCGNGSGFLHNDPAPELMHLRAMGVLHTIERGRLDVGFLAGAGLAELQVAADEAGFKTGAARSEDQVEAAGPELSAGIKGRLWVLPGAYVVGDLNVGAAHMPAAPDVLGRGGAVVPFGTIGVGLGF